MLDPRQWIAPGKGIGFALVLALLVGIAVFGGHPSAAPAAVSGFLDDNDAATPVIVDPTETSTPTQTPTPTATPDYCATATAIAEAEPTQIATPVAMDEPGESLCPTPDVTVEPTIVPTNAPPVQTESPVIPDPVTPTPVTSDTSSEPEIGSDPSMAGIPDDLPDDPGLTGLDTGAPAIGDAEDPSLFGLAPPAVMRDSDAGHSETAVVLDPSVAGLTFAVGDLSLSSSGSGSSGGGNGPVDSGDGIFRRNNKAIQVAAVSPDGAVLAGGVITYEFRVSNIGNGTVNLSLMVVINQPLWNVSMDAPEADDHHDGRIQLHKGEATTVYITVTAPVTARPGDEAVAYLSVADMN